MCVGEVRKKKVDKLDLDRVFSARQRQSTQQEGPVQGNREMQAQMFPPAVFQ